MTSEYCKAMVESVKDVIRAHSEHTTLGRGYRGCPREGMSAGAVLAYWRRKLAEARRAEAARTVVEIRAIPRR